jgi:protein phosphatase
MTSRWDPDSARNFRAFANRRIPARTLSAPLALYRYRTQLLAIFPWEGETLLVNEPAPLQRNTVVQLAFQLADALQRLHDYGVVLDGLGPQHILVRPSGSGRLFDLDVAGLRKTSIQPNDDPTVPPRADVRALAAALDDFCPIEAQALRDLLTSIRRGAAETADEMASMVASWARRQGGTLLRSRAAVHTDPGLVHVGNEDSWSWRPLTGGGVMLAVADGWAGGSASSLATRTVDRHLRRAVGDTVVRVGDLEGLVNTAFAAANAAVRTAASNASSASAADTTLCLALQADGKMVVGRMGDTYAWVLRGRQLKLLGERDKRVALLGGKKAAEPRIASWTVQSGDRLLMGTRGVWMGIGEEVLCDILRSELDPRSAVRRLVRAANDAGGQENITAAVLDL